MGILTNLDKFKMNKTLQKTKKTLKQRFWTEIYKGAKVFEFTGVTNRFIYIYIYIYIYNRILIDK